MHAASKKICYLSAASASNDMKFFICCFSATPTCFPAAADLSHLTSSLAFMTNEEVSLAQPAQPLGDWQPMIAWQLYKPMGCIKDPMSQWGDGEKKPAYQPTLAIGPLGQCLVCQMASPPLVLVLGTVLNIPGSQSLVCLISVNTSTLNMPGSAWKVEL